MFMNTPLSPVSGRLASLDILRGFDLFLLVFFQPVLFMTGASMPFSFSKFKNAPNKWHIYRKIIKRFVLLFIFGMIVQGNLLGLNPDSLYLYSNTLQAIATGYLIAAIILLHCSFRYQVLITLLLLLLYWIPMTSGWCVLGRRWKLAFFSLLYLYLDME